MNLDRFAWCMPWEYQLKPIEEDEPIRVYMFLTNEGNTTDNEGKETENCQVLGIARGTTSESALWRLLKDNPHIVLDHGFEHVECYELATGEIDSYHNVKLKEEVEE